MPGAGKCWPTEKRPQLKRILVEKAWVHVYFEVYEKKQTILIVSVWDSRRKNPPKL